MIENNSDITNIAFIFEFQLEVLLIVYKVYYHSESYSVYSHSVSAASGKV